MQKLWQLYNEVGEVLPGKSADWQEVFNKGLLHAAAHVWIWRRNATGIEVLVQKRAVDKMTYPNMLDVSAAGHVDLGETEQQTALRETKEEIGIIIAPKNLEFSFKYHSNQKFSSTVIENEWKFVYLYELPKNEQFSLQKEEVAELLWKPFNQFKSALQAEPQAGQFVYQGDGYFPALLEALGSK